MLRAAGFENIEARRMDFHLGDWGHTEKERRIGAITLENVSAFIELVGVKILENHPTLSLAKKEELARCALEDLRENGNRNQYYLPM